MSTGPGDPHIHVDNRVLQTGAAYRNLVVASVGSAPDAPTVVTTGCGLRVAYAMTSRRPESVTCLPCRNHAEREHLRFAEHVERLGRLPGSPMAAGQATGAARWARDLATRYSSR
ncbi:hypothetical protein [Frankia sp. AgB32]|uniref:hypothetical protein n=1 Tax=Frankia sp. AgB32 TaxID=631119 RepID=UPI00200EA9DD|nr:hypothetical protein [Frankia sp. AgB32]MCK9896859.1 hypothetical protein [Frankia sp. AgB32]